MHPELAHYYPLSEERLTAVHAESTIVLDASALLHSYRLRDRALEAWFATLTALSDRVWVPHQAGLEYHRNRLKVIDDQLGLVRGIENEVGKAFKGIEGELSKRAKDVSRCRLLDNSELDQALADARSSFEELITTARSRSVSLREAQAAEDQTGDRLTKLLDGKVGDRLTNLTDIYKDGKERYRNEVPPGYRDLATKRLDHELYGDLVIWKEVLREVQRGLVQ